MNRFILTSLGLLFLLSVYAQKTKNRYELSYGLQRLQNKTVFSMTPQPFDCPVGTSILSEIQEKPLILPTISIFKYHSSDVKNLNLISGVGFNQKGYLETGLSTAWDDPAIVKAYSVPHIFSYVVLHAGLNYSFLEFGGLSLSVGEVINSEMPIKKEDINAQRYRPMVFSSNTCIMAEFSLNGKFGLIIKPFFQTALTRYNSIRTDFYGKIINNNYRPYGSGLSVGLSF